MNPYDHLTEFRSAVRTLIDHLDGGRGWCDPPILDLIEAVNQTAREAGFDFDIIEIDSQSVLPGNHYQICVRMDEVGNRDIVLDDVYEKRRGKIVRRSRLDDANGAPGASVLRRWLVARSRAGNPDVSTPKDHWWTFSEAWRYMLNNCTFIETEAAAQSQLNRWSEADPAMSQGKGRGRRRIDPEKVRRYCKRPPA